MGARARQSLVIVLCAGVTCCGGNTPGMQPAAATSPAPLVVITSFTVVPRQVVARLRGVEIT